MRPEDPNPADEVARRANRGRRPAHEGERPADRDVRAGREHPLAAVDRDLRASPRRRLELLEEVRADAEGLQSELVRRGRRPGQARRAALQYVVPSGEALAALETQLAPPLGRWARTAGWLDRIERVGIALATIGAGIVTFLSIRWPGTTGPTAVLAGLQIVTVALLAGNWTQAAARLWIDGDLRPERRRHLWNRQVGLMVTAVSVGALGAAWESYAALDAFSGEGVSAAAIARALRSPLSFAGLGLAAATFGLFGWLALTPRLITDESIERRISALFSRTGAPWTARPGIAHPERQGDTDVGL